MIEINDERLLVSSHAHHKMHERGIDLELLKEALRSPDHIDTDSTDGIIKVSYRNSGDEILIVVLKKKNDEYIVITTYNLNKPYDIFKLNIEKSEKLISGSPEAAIILAISAFEAFCSKVFSEKGPLEKYLIDKRRVSFQQLDSTKEIFRLHFGIDLTADSISWQMLQKMLKYRHELIHSAGVNKDGSLVRIDRNFASEGMEAIKKLVSTICHL